MNEYLGSIIDVTVDKPIGSRNSKYNFIYPINYGYTEDKKLGSNKKIGVYILGEFEALEEFRGRVIGIIKRKNHREDQLVVAKRLISYGKSDLEVLTEFQERYFESEVISSSNRPAKDNIRVTVLGLARRDDDILVSEAIDGVVNINFYRFPGGGIKFAEKSEKALRREFLEELNTEIKSLKYLCKIENIFEFEEEKKHELILVYEIELPAEFYKKEEMIINENGIRGKALWVDKNEFLNGSKILYPIEIKKYL